MPPTPIIGNAFLEVFFKYLMTSVDLADSGFPLNPPFPISFKVDSGVFKLSLLVVVLVEITPASLVAFTISIV